MRPLRLSYQTIEFDEFDIHVRTLRDLQQFSDDTGEAERLGVSLASWPLFGVVWDSSLVLAQLMSAYRIEGRRILEVGCGIGLASLVLNCRLADVTATDYHPEAGRFLAENVGLNGGRAIPFVRTGWADAPSELGRFDLIIGSDLLYEPDHVDLLSDFIEQHARPQCEVIVVDPARGWQSRFTRKMRTLGYSMTSSSPPLTPQPPPDFRGDILRYLR